MITRPITFNALMVQANLAGTKTQTRRIVKLTDTGRVKAPGSSQNWHLQDPNAVNACPYGQPGDQLWVREAHYLFGHWEPIPGKLTKGRKQKWAFISHPNSAVTFTPPAIFRKGRHHKDPATPAWHKRLARFMPRKFSRITLAITGIRVERLQDITREDAIAEGIENIATDKIMSPWKDYTPDAKYRTHPGWDDPIYSYRSLWDSINGPGSSAENPYVWVITFHPVITP